MKDFVRTENLTIICCWTNILKGNTIIKHFLLWCSPVLVFSLQKIYGHVKNVLPSISAFSTLTSITNRFYSIWLRILFLSLTFWRTLVCTKFNIKGLSWQGCLTDTKELNINNRCNYRENVHIMVLPVAETIEKQLMVVLRDRQQDLTDFLGPVLFIQILLSSRLITLLILLIQQWLFVH